MVGVMFFALFLIVANALRQQELSQPRLQLQADLEVL